ncbi:relaxase domain-containing protein [Streptomyces albiflaviniger]|nr:relaxase domain-containing protein [Streptomyces albiflaviniger]
MMDIELTAAGQMHRCYPRQAVVGDGRRPARMPLRKAQEEAGVPAGRRMGRGLPRLGLAPGQEVTAARIETAQRAIGKTPAAARRAGALGRRAKVASVAATVGASGRSGPSACCGPSGTSRRDRRSRAWHERAIAVVIAWIEDDVAVIRYNAAGSCHARSDLADGRAAARPRLTTRGLWPRSRAAPSVHESPDRRDTP